MQVNIVEQFPENTIIQGRINPRIVYFLEAKIQRCENECAKVTMLQTYQILASNLFSFFVNPNWRMQFRERTLNFMEKTIDNCQDEVAKANMLISYNTFAQTLICNYMI